jgi:hypothetical protein
MIVINIKERNLIIQQPINIDIMYIVILMD